jgi:hypothetical protein
MSDAERLRSKERYHACKLPELFQVLVAQVDGSQELAFSNLIALLDSGLRLYAAEPGYVGDNDTIHKGDMKVAIIKAKKIGRIDAEDIRVPVQVAVEGGTTWQHEQPLRELWVTRTNLEQACRALGKSDLPWPKDGLSAHWEIHARIEELQTERNRITAFSAKSIDEERWRTSRVAELDRDLQAAWEELRQLDQADVIADLPAGGRMIDEDPLQEAGKQDMGDPALRGAPHESETEPRDGLSRLVNQYQNDYRKQGGNRRVSAPHAEDSDDVNNSLRRLVEKVGRETAKPRAPPLSAEKIIARLASFDNESTIEQIDSAAKRIYWVDDYGDKQNTAFKTINNWLTAIRSGHSS